MARFRPGESGNPHGRPPKNRSVAEYVRAKSGEDGRRYIDLLDELAMDEKQPARIRIDAARILLSRGFGNPVEEVSIETSSEVLRATQLREILRSEGMLTRPAPLEPSKRPDLDGWLRGDLDWTPE